LRRTSMMTFVFILCYYTKSHIANEASYQMNLKLELGMVKCFSLIHMQVKPKDLTTKWMFYQ
jgi:hypothetical protein